MICSLQVSLLRAVVWLLSARTLSRRVVPSIENHDTNKHSNDSNNNSNSSINNNESNSNHETDETARNGLSSSSSISMNGEEQGPNPILKQEQGLDFAPGQGLDFAPGQGLNKGSDKRARSRVEFPICPTLPTLTEVRAGGREGLREGG